MSLGFFQCFLCQRSVGDLFLVEIGKCSLCAPCYERFELVAKEKLNEERRIAFAKARARFFEQALLPVLLEDSDE